MIAGLKFLHIAGLGLWCAALVALPILMQSLGQTKGQTKGQIAFDRFRLVTHVTYVAVATPAALLTIGAGIGLIFAAGVFTPWLVVKLALVSGMVMMHIWFGHLVQISGEERKSRFAVPPVAGLGVVIVLIVAVLVMVLSKPDLGVVQDWLPAYLLAPRGAAGLGAS